MRLLSLLYFSLPQDPVNPDETLIVIQSLVPGGVAQRNGGLFPGDRIMFVNNTNLEQASLDKAVATFKGAPQGLMRIGVVKPLPLFETPFFDQVQQVGMEKLIND